MHGFKELSLRIVSLGIVCMGTFIRNTSLASLRVGSFAWEISFGILRFETSVWKLSIDNLRLGPFMYYINHISYGIIMAYLWSSLVFWIIWHIILYCNACTCSYISLYYIASYIWLCCLIHGTVVASHVLGYSSFDLIYVRDIIHFYNWPFFPNNMAYHAVL